MRAGRHQDHHVVQVDDAVELLDQQAGRRTLADEVLCRLEEIGVDNAALPAEMKIDYIRAYASMPGGGG